ncbi:hypothetical protein SAMN05660690_2583 [Geodermatophilus telluris]|uniref:Uncharacterized protein n=1 Tax=Geodermatophilus telluris TaxID=1190417 RepID=A0A1G6PHM3_9ACTN|nr:hypothetical protein [Geodermatophilus telluris]SDC79548.1 hypothetical protein SAMN05660690_2583 [Geodermatophilus telluris]
MSRPLRSPGPAATAARATLSADDAARFDRLVSAVLTSPGAALGPALRAQLPGPAGVRWLRTAGLPPTTRAAALTAEQWLSLYRCWRSVASVPHAGRSGRAPVGRPSAHGHAPGALAAPRWF